LKLNRWLAFLVIIATPAFGQNSNPESGKRKYILPVFPNQINTIAGSMGELRFSHFHTGIDIRTQGRIGLPVVATADGYINRITVQTAGYGNSLYIQHPDGRISVYGHLNHFNKEIAEKVRQEQYKRQRFELTLFPAKNQFPVKQGDTIAFSGNSGSSGGPHVHFDIRTANQNLLNPMEFGLKEIRDDLPPVPRRLSLVPLNKNSRINGEFRQAEFDLIHTKNEFKTRDTIEANGVIGFELYAYDRQNYTFFRTGVPTIKMFVNDQQVFNQNIVEFSFSDQSSINIHTDYRKKLETGRSYSKLFLDDGNTLPFYQALNKGKVKIEPGNTYLVRIELKDTYENKSELNFIVKGVKNNENQNIKRLIKNLPQSQLVENTLVLSVNKDSLLNGKLDLYFSGSRKSLSPDYTINENISVFLWDLRKGMPDSALIQNWKKTFNFKAMVPPGLDYKFYNEIADISFQKNSLFDTLYMTIGYSTNEQDMEIFNINQSSEPLKSSIKVTLKLKQNYSSKSAVYAVDANQNLSYVGGDWEGNFITFRTSSFGNYTLASDSIAPVITPIILNRNNITLKIEDKLSGIKEFRANLDGKWLLMNYDYKKKLIWSEKLNPDDVLKGDFILKVSDNANNESIYKTKIQ